MGADWVGTGTADTTETKPGTGVPKLVLEALEPLDLVDFLESLKADLLDITKADFLKTLQVVAFCTGAW